MTALVLVVDDDDDLREAICEALVDEGYEAVGAADGAAALVKLRQRTAHLILLDVMMPNMNGWEFCAELRRDPTLAGIPLVVMTAASTVNRKDELTAAAYLQKPFALGRLFDILHQVLGDQ